ncbi:MAG: HAD-IA family hydrolase, partial [candidate division NC10 bacterium]|nr:HAD-IA family hydrolase [candidate division NC10 bacterium]
MISKKEGRQAIELLIFDLDCTLADTKLDLAMATNYALRQLGLPELPPEQIYGYIGNGVKKIIERALTPKNESLHPRALALFREHYADYLLDHTRLYPHVCDTLEYFKGKKKAVATNKDTAFTLKMLKGLGIMPYFEMILGGDATEHLKPNPEPLVRILTTLQAAPSRSAMVGDSVGDVVAGRQAQMITCALTYGLGKREDLIEAGPDYLLDDLWELTE